MIAFRADMRGMRSVTGLCAGLGTFLGGYVPSLWGGSPLSLVSVVCAALGGIAGVWFGARLSDV